MEFHPSKKLGHADGLSSLIPKLSEQLEETDSNSKIRKKKKKEKVCFATP